MNPKVRAARLFVGRASELALLTEALDEAVAGRGRLTMIRGESGIGKTALVDEHLARAEERGMLVARSTCFENETTPPYGPWVHLLQRLARGGHPPDRLQLRRWLAGSRTEGELERVELFDMIASHLTQVAAECGLVAVLEDVQWADLSSLLLMRQLVDDLANARVHLVVTCNDENDASISASLLRDLSRLAGSHAIVLSNLGDAEVSRYLETRLGPDFIAAHRSDLLTRSAGNPLYMTEVARLIESGASLRTIPRGIRDLLDRRLSVLPDGTRETLRWASVIGPEFGVQLLADVVGLDTQSVLTQLDAAVGSKVVAPAPESPARLRFAHELLREALSEEIPLSVRGNRHRKVAEAIERLWAADLPDHLAELAYHWQKAGSQPAKAIEWTLRAADHAIDRLAYEEGVRFYEAALRLPGVTDRAEIMHRLARAQYLAGEIQSAFRTSRQLAELARSLGRPTLFAEAALVLEGVGDPGLVTDIAQMCTDALDWLGDEELGLRARLLGQLAVQLSYVDFARLADISAEAVALAQKSGSNEALVSALRARQMARSGADGVTERLDLAAQMIQLGSSTRQPRLTLWGRLWRIDAFLQLADMPALDAEQEELQRLVDRLQQPLARWHLIRLRAARAAFHGDYRGALELAEEAREVGRRGGHGVAEHIWMAFRVSVAMERGEQNILAELLPHIRSPLPVQKLMRALGLLTIGLDAEAKALFDAGEAQLKSHPMDHQWLSAASALSEVGCKLSSVPTVEWLYPRLQPFAGHLAVPGAGPPIFIRGGGALWLGMMAALLGKEEAEAHFHQAVTMHDRLGARPYAARSRFEYAKLLAAAARVRPAQTLAQSALTAASELEMVPLANEARALLESLSRTAESPLSRRETEIADRVAEGMTNKEIADALFLSERTVETHVQNILGKLGFRTRTQIAAWATQRIAKN